MQNCLAVILAAGRGSRMFPLTEETPKCLLPVANKPLVWYTLELLKRGGFQEAIVIVREREGGNILDVVNQFEGLTLSLLRIPDSEDWGTADSLRCLKERGKLKAQHTDILVISSDLITSVPVHFLIEFHSCHQSTLTLLVADSSQDDDEPSQHRKPISAVERDVIALAAGHQLVYYAAQADLDESLTFSRSLLKKYPHMRVSSRLQDAHIYLMQKWVLDYLMENRSISSVKGELVPHLVRNQWTQVSQKKKKEAGFRQVLQSYAATCVDETEQLALNCSSFSGYSGPTSSLCPPLILCHALQVSDQLCKRVNSIPTYMEANKLLSLSSPYDTIPQLETKKTKGVSGCIGEGVVLAEKINIKHSTIGNHCHIGDRSKVTHCIIMDHVNIGESVVLQGCVVCSHSRVGDRACLKDCLVGTNFTVTPEADMKGETLVVGGGLHI